MSNVIPILYCTQNTPKISFVEFTEPVKRHDKFKKNIVIFKITTQ